MPTGEIEGRWYRLVAENASDVVVMSDREGRFIWVSPSSERTLGLTPAEMVGHTAFDFVHPDDRDVLTAAQQHVLAGEEQRFELRFRAGGHEWKWLSIMYRPVVDDAGAVTGRVCGWRDVDEQHRAQEALRASEEQLRFIIDQASDLVVVLVDGIPTFVSPAITAMLGWRPEDLLGRPATEFWHPDDQEAAVALREQVQRDVVAEQLLRMRHRDGSYRWIEVTGRPAPTPDGRLGAVGVLRDVTARVEEERQREVVRARDRLMAEMSSDVFAVYSSDGVIEDISGAVVQIAGRSAEQMIGRNGAELFLEEDRDEATDNRVRLERGELLRGLVRVVRPDGSTRWVDRRTRAVFDERGRLEHFVSAWRDAHAEVEYSEALAAATEAAQAANLAKTTFLSRMSHELRTPLNAVLGFAQLLQMDDLSAEQQASLAHILGGGRHLLELINEVLDIARIESGRLTVSPEPVLVADVVVEAMELMRPLALQHGVVLDGVDAAQCADVVVVDRQRMIQILLNLLSNAVKYNRRGGAVRVRCDHAPGQVLVRVADDGLGIGAVDLPKLFAPFERLGAEGSEVEGTGIGLALSRGLAEIMGAELTVESTVGVGSTFTLVLSVAVGQVPGQAAAEVVPPAHESSGRTTRVLYVEDNPANVRLMRSIVARRPGVELHTVGNGEEALTMASTAAFDLVLLDLHLPDVHGEDVLRRLRTQPTTASVPVVVLTADASAEARDRVTMLGADAFLLKPVDVGEVLHWIDHPNRARADG
jgi:PAS domain S-box-containing protein